MNNKGIMLEFIVTVILALIIFIPACYGVSKLFRTSAQGEDSFQEFAKALEDFAGSEKERASFLLKMDQNSMVAVFRQSGRQDDFGQHVITAPASCTSFPCVCLCRTAAFESREEFGRLPEYYYSCTEEICRQPKGVSLQESWFVFRDPEEPRRVVVEMQKQEGKLLIGEVR